MTREELLKLKSELRQLKAMTNTVFNIALLLVFAIAVGVLVWVAR